eukprot:TRINITY_DN21539_c0_g2_i1.p1 TRINITY_DN21539_c0_g2~~TRINITY_DN21539_c0_g2_i1.p1  ORF type:complete len:365 (-),score=33.77 TRINITY_DN21539_c0_g2_i1:44-1138(-)
MQRSWRAFGMMQFLLTARFHLWRRRRSCGTIVRMLYVWRDGRPLVTMLAYTSKIRLIQRFVRRALSDLSAAAQKVENQWVRLEIGLISAQSGSETSLGKSALPSSQTSAAESSSRVRRRRGTTAVSAVRAGVAVSVSLGPGCAAGGDTSSNVVRRRGNLCHAGVSIHNVVLPRSVRIDFIWEELRALRRAVIAARDVYREEDQAQTRKFRDWFIAQRAIKKRIARRKERASTFFGIQRPLESFTPAPHLDPPLCPSYFPNDDAVLDMIKRARSGLKPRGIQPRRCRGNRDGESDTSAPAPSQLEAVHDPNPAAADCTSRNAESFLQEEISRLSTLPADYSPVTGLNCSFGEAGGGETCEDLVET